MKTASPPLISDLESAKRLRIDQQIESVRPIHNRIADIEAELAECRQKSAVLKRERNALRRRLEQITDARWTWLR